MPIIEVYEAHEVIVIKRSLSPGFAGIDNDLFYEQHLDALRRRQSGGHRIAAEIGTSSPASYRLVVRVRRAGAGRAELSGRYTADSGQRNWGQRNMAEQKHVDHDEQVTQIIERGAPGVRSALQAFERAEQVYYGAVMATAQQEHVTVSAVTYSKAIATEPR